jgi:hypothetical protein
MYNGLTFIYVMGKNVFLYLKDFNVLIRNSIS